MEQKTPSQKVTSAPYDGKEITDSLGRKLKLRKPDILDMYDLMSAIGEDAKSPTCAAMAQNVLYVATIDGQVIPRITKYSEFRATLQRLGNAGVYAIGEYLLSLDENEDGGSDKAKK